MKDSETASVAEADETHSAELEYSINALGENIKALGENIAETLRTVLITERSLAHLMSNDVYDIEFIEGDLGTDAARELATAAAHLRNVDRIVKLRRQIL